MNSIETNNILINNNLELFSKCTRKFCGQISNTSLCTSCLWGSKVFYKFNNPYNPICELCLTSFTLYNWLYIGFIMILPIIFLLQILPILSLTKIDLKHLEQSTTTTNSNISSTTHKMSITQKSWLLFLCCIIIHLLTSLIIILIYPPLGSFTLYHCPIDNIKEFYPILYAGIGCISEVNYPLTSLPILYYIINIIISLLIYSLLIIIIFNDYYWFDYLYYILYAYPIICINIILFGGILYYIYPYIILFYSIFDSLYRFPLIFDYCINDIDDIICPICNPYKLIQTILYKPKQYLFIIIINSFYIGYGLLALNITIYYWYISLISLPFIFYMITLPLTHPFHYNDCQQILNRIYHISFLNNEKKEETN
ncbi:unnamed protein product [Schistosoma margrebowiei]|uniref:JNK1/MAPK8-associated membrane protein n=1 Tax=Schistosoma margrebowiei TaxID=48269 RepID=A0AA85AQ16_9TREM|nr:unnamed protein product [Schistosoma margrebowiei]